MLLPFVQTLSLITICSVDSSYSSEHDYCANWIPLKIISTAAFVQIEYKKIPGNEFPCGNWILRFISANTVYCLLNSKWKVDVYKISVLFEIFNSII